MTNETPADFGTGLRAALERRGVLDQPQPRVGLLSLLVEADDDQPRAQLVAKPKLVAA